MTDASRVSEMPSVAAGRRRVVAKVKDAESRPPLYRRALARLFLPGLAAALYIGWRERGEEHLTAESGLGYALGIVGSVMMLLLLLYPLRKRFRFAAGLGKVSDWFRIHMILGVVGPALVIFHSGYKLGATNSNVALFAMLLVAASGLVGRYLYSKIHSGLYGHSISLDELRRRAEETKRAPGLDIAESVGILERLRTFEHDNLRTPSRAGEWIGLIVTVGTKSRGTKRRLRRHLRRSFRPIAAQRGWDRATRRRQYKLARAYIGAYVAAVQRVAEFTVYERFFALWHIFHLPLFILLVLAAVTHVVAVHLY